MWNAGIQMVLGLKFILNNILPKHIKIGGLKARELRNKQDPRPQQPQSTNEE